MSAQQINLLDPRLLTLRVAFSAKTLAWTLLAVVVAGLVLYAVVQSSADEVRQQLEQAQAKRDALQAKLDALSQPTEDAQAAADKQALRLGVQMQHIARLKVLQSALGTVPGRVAFSARLRALAAEGLPGVWVTGIEIGEHTFRLDGRALEPERIPDYLALLARQPALKDLPLTGFSIATSETESGAAAQGVAFIVNPGLETK